MFKVQTMLFIKLTLSHIVILVSIVLQHQVQSSSNFCKFLPEGDLFDCLIGTSYTPIDPVSETFILKPVQVDFENGRSSEIEGVDKVEFNRSSCSYNSSFWNPRLPVKIFVNGYNLNNPIRYTWMYDVAQIGFTRSGFRTTHRKFNYVIIYWKMPNLHGENNFDRGSYYFKTMNKYKLIVANVAAVIDEILDSFSNCSSTLIETDDGKQLREQIGKSELYGHSLGAHVVYHAARIVLDCRKEKFKFGKIVGLDPSRMCFDTRYFGINGDEGQKYAHETVVVHTSSGFFGTQHSQGTIEIAPNGGTIQPGCETADLGCHHIRSWGLFNYIDDLCQMVAYTCNNHSLFTLGACFHPRLPIEFELEEFRLVNLPEQHSDDIYHIERSEITTTTGDTNQYHEPLFEGPDYILEDLVRSLKEKSQMPQEEPYLKRYFYLKTEAPHLNEFASHCMQHYQVRLVILNADSRKKCPITKFAKDGSDGLSVMLQRVFDEKSCPTKCKLESGRVETHSIQLKEMIDSRLFTQLMTFSGEAAVYTSAVIENIDIGGWAKCITKNDSDGRFTFILDIAFMSNILPRMRRLFSTILCGKWDETKNVSEIRLEMCDRIRWPEAGRYVDAYLLAGNFREHDPWYKRMMNNIYGTILGWKPWRH